ncbi:hypothetical protein V8E53_012443 [Lactarius tabidus]
MFMNRTDSMITSLMVYSINSGLLTSLLAVAMTITFVLLPSSLIWVGLYWLMSKCYVNSFLAMLNSRDHVRNRSTIDNLGNSFNLSSKSGQAGVAATVHRPTTLNSARNKSDHDVEPTFEGSQPVRLLYQLRRRGRYLFYLQGGLGTIRHNLGERVTGNLLTPLVTLYP